jgi:hypothetical protein
MKQIKSLFHIAASQAAEDRKCSLKIVWLAGVNGNHVDARILNTDTSIERGKATIEVEMSLDGLSAAAAIAKMREKIVECLDKLT